MEIEKAKRLFRENLKRLRVARGCEMSEAAKRAGISVKRYQKMESGATVPRLLTLVRLATVFEVDADALFRE